MNSFLISYMYKLLQLNASTNIDKRVNTYILFDGLTYNTRGYFASCVVFFRAPAGARKNASNEENVREYYMLNHRIRDLLFHYTKRRYFASILFGKSVSKKCIICPSGRLRTM